MKRIAVSGILILITVALAVACQQSVLAPPEPAGLNTPTPIPPTHTPTPTATPSPTPLPTPTRTPTAASTSSDSDGDVAFLSGEPFEMVLTEQEVNELTQEALTTQPNVPISNVHVRLLTEHIVINGQVRLGFFTTDVELTGAIPVEDGKPAPEIIDLKIGGGSLGGPLRAQLVGMITPYLDQLAQTNLAVNVEDVQITPGVLRILGRYK